MGTPMYRSDIVLDASSRRNARKIQRGAECFSKGCGLFSLILIWVLAFERQDLFSCILDPSVAMAAPHNQSGSKPLPERAAHPNQQQHGIPPAMAPITRAPSSGGKDHQV